MSHEGPSAVPAEPQQKEADGGLVAQEDAPQQLRLVGESGQQPAVAFREIFN